MDSLLEKLNPAQKEAVIWPPNKPLLILAGAGSGKTRILTHRIGYLLSCGVRSFNILGVTFTNKAAEEMRHRVQKLVNQDVWVSTFHSTCLRILRIDGAALGLDPHFAIYDEQDGLAVIREIVRELKMDEKQMHPKGVRERISRAKDMLITPFQYAEKAPDFYEEAVGKIYKIYEERMAGLKACDFGDLIMKTVALFDRRPDILRTWQDRFQHILIDEYQDTNHAQYRLVKLLASARRQITVVGDPDQSIYAWRGADIKNILSYEQDYPDCGIIRMEQNYRSTQVILDAANELIARNQMRKPKNLWTEKKGGQRISLFEAMDEKEEAFYVASQVMKYKQQGKNLADQVIFYRTHAQSRVLEDVMRRFKIPYRIVGGVRFYDRKEIKDLMAYLRVIAFPSDEISLKRVLNVPTRGIGDKAQDLLEEYGRTHNKNFDEVLKEAGKIEGLTPRARKSIQSFASLISSLRKQKDSPVGELLHEILSRTRYVENLEQEKTVEAQSRIENIEEFFSVIEDFEENPPVPLPVEGEEEREELTPLLSFLESLSLMSDLDTWDEGTNVLTMMTLHTAKGLEFPIVYMVGMEEGIFPHVNAYTDTEDDLEEERRLCYVGVTRTKEKLHMLCARERRLYGTRQHNLPSRFLNEIPHELFENSALRLQQPAPQEDDDLSIEFDMDEIKRRILFE